MGSGGEQPQVRIGLLIDAIDHSVLRLDFRGHGRSGRAPGAYQMADYLSDAVAVTVWPTAIVAPRRRRTVAHKALFRIVGTLWDCIAVLLKLVGLVDYKFPGINQHHHQHAAGENIVGGNFALVV